MGSEQWIETTAHPKQAGEPSAQRRSPLASRRRVGRRRRAAWGPKAPVQAAAWRGSRRSEEAICERSELAEESRWGRSPAAGPRPKGAGNLFFSRRVAKTVGRVSGREKRVARPRSGPAGVVGDQRGPAAPVRHRRGRAARQGAACRDPGRKLGRSPTLAAFTCLPADRPTNR